MIKLLGIYGGPRRNGNTDILLDEALVAAAAEGAEVEKFHLAELDFSGCTSCGSCRETGVCTVKDDMQKLFPKFNEFNRFIIASPIYFKGVSWLTKSMIDRFQCCWIAKYRLKDVPWSKEPARMGAFISACGDKSPDMFTPAVSTIKSVYITLDIEYKFELLVNSIDEKGVVSTHPGLLERARELGRKLVSEDPE